MRFNLKVLLSLGSCLLTACGGDAGLPWLHGASDCDSEAQQTTPEASLCGWALGPHAVIYGNVEGLSLRWTPMYTPVLATEGPDYRTSLDDVSVCEEQSLAAGLVIDVDVTDVIAGDIAAGPIAVNVAANVVNQWDPGPHVDDGGELVWAGFNSGDGIIVGQPLGMPIYLASDGEWTLGRGELFVERNAGIEFQGRGRACIYHGAPRDEIGLANVQSLKLRVGRCERDQLEGDDSFAVRGIYAEQALMDESGIARGGACFRAIEEHALP